MTPEILKRMQISKVFFVSRNAGLSIGLSESVAETLAKKAAYDYEHMQDYVVGAGPASDGA